MKKAWPWIIGGFVVLLIIGFLWFGNSNRQAYRVARGAVNQQVDTTQAEIDAAVEMAIAAVDKMLALAGDLPSQQAEADLIKQDIEEIGNRLKEAAAATGDAAMDKLDQSIDQFNQTLETVDQASNAATDPVVKSKLDRLYGMLEAVKEGISQLILRTQQ